MEIVVEAVDEVGNSTILATFAVIGAVLPNAAWFEANSMRESLRF